LDLFPKDFKKRAIGIIVFKKHSPGNTTKRIHSANIELLDAGRVPAKRNETIPAGGEEDYLHTPLQELLLPYTLP